MTAILWGFPCGKQVNSDWLRRMAEFHDKTAASTSMPLVANHPGRVDIARSWMIDTLKKNPKYDWLFSWDTDVCPQDESDGPFPGIALDRIIEWVEECRALGFDMVAGATINDSGDVLFYMESANEWLAISDVNPFEIAWAAGGFFAMSRRCAQHLKVVAKMTIVKGDTLDLYCTNTAQGGEDYTLYKNVRDSGFRACLDPRIRVGHRKETYRFIDPAWYDRQRTVVAESLKERARRLEADA